MKYVLALLLALTLAATATAQEVTEPLVCEATVEATVLSFVGSGDIEVIKTAGRSGRFWSAEAGVATVSYLTTEYVVDLDEEGVEFCLALEPVEEVVEGVELIQYVNPGRQVTYKLD
jgi:hypothetical protein